MRFNVWLIYLFVLVNPKRADEIVVGKQVQNTDLAKEIDYRLLVFSTLDGQLFGVEQQTGNIRWKIKDRSVVRSPKDSVDTIIPLFLPNPHDGSLYLVGGGKELLKKLPFTIPELVKSSPCRSTDGILYTGKKKDTWFTLDPTTGRREQILGWDSPNGPTCPVASAEAIYLGRTDYSIMMIDSKHINRKWNVSFYEYTAVAITKESLNNYEFAHFTSSSTGYVITMDRRRAVMQWENDFGSPIVAAYILDPEGLISLPFTSLSNHSLNNFALNLINNENSPNAQKLYPTLYIGEHNEGLYALPSFIDQNIITLLSPGQKPLLLAGPDGSHLPQDYMEYPIPGQNYYIPTDMPDDPLLFQSIPDTWAPILQFGHYELPEYSKTKLQITGNTHVFSKLITDESDKKESKQIQTDPIYQERVLFRWEDVKYVSTILITGIVVVMYFLIQKKVENRMTDSSRGSTGSNSVLNMPTQEGLVCIGKIQFKTDHLLGKGCDGTFVYRGEFEGRSVAVKRLLPECFSFADREVSLLRESDAHPNVVRYFCTEQDSLFRYIALELCEATLSDYVENSRLKEAITPLEILEQATRGLEHLHSLNIVHRDIKPQNVLLSMVGPRGKARAMISDFGLCKKLQVGRTSFSRKSGITGTDGWIAPEMFNETHRTTCAVDMFSLGCLFYYVLSNGKHPFGDMLRRQANISSGESNLNNLTDNLWKVEVYKPLVKSLISPKPHKRPSCKDVLSYPIFWNNSTILTFLQDVSDRVETASPEDPVLSELERNARVVVRGNWRNSIDEAVAADLKKYRTYKGHCLRDLLRALRNKKHHFRELDKASQEALGEIPDQFTAYWTNRFPLLLIHSWLTMQTVSHEETFKQFYNAGGYIYPLHLIDYSVHEKEITENLLDVDDVKFTITQNEPKVPFQKYPRQNKISSNEEGKVGLYRNGTPNRRFNKKKVKENEAPLVWVVPQ